MPRLSGNRIYGATIGGLVTPIFGATGPTICLVNTATERSSDASKPLLPGRNGIMGRQASAHTASPHRRYRQPDARSLSEGLNFAIA